MSGDLTIRDVTAADEARWRELWAGYLVFYQSSLPDSVTNSTWNGIVNQDFPFGCLVAERDGEIIGFANYIIHPFTWTEAPICLLNDLFVDPAKRSGGAGRALIDAVIERAKEQGWGRVYWVTKHDNVRARTLYDQYGPTDGFVRYSVKLV